MSEKKTLDIDEKLVDNAVSLWRAGQLVAIPTETVYGLAADATNGEAVARIYQVKTRPSFNPLIVHVADVATAKRYVQWNDWAEKLAAACWPGPLTLVLRRRVFCPISELVSAGQETLAVRIPSHPIARQLLSAFGGGLAAPSANRSGRVSPTTAQHVRDELAEAIPLIIDGGQSQLGLESTVLDVSGETPVLLRPGSVTRAMIEEQLFAEANKKKNPVGHAAKKGLRDPDAADTHKSPGMMQSHYAPSIPVRLSAEAVAAAEALLAFGPAPLAGAATTLNLSPSGNLLEAAANLFAYLRLLDDPKHKAIAVMHIPKEGIGEAIADRLRRAAS